MRLSRLRIGVAVSERQGGSRRFRTPPAANALPLTTPILSLDDARVRIPAPKFPVY